MVRKHATDIRLIRPRARRIPPLAALLFAVCVLMIFNLSGLRFYRYLDTSKKNDLTQRLQSVARSVALSLQTPELITLLAGVADLPPDDQRSRLEQYGD